MNAKDAHAHRIMTEEDTYKPFQEDELIICEKCGSVLGVKDEYSGKFGLFCNKKIEGGNMGKCWMIKSEDEFIGEGTFITIGGVNHYFPGARITEYPSNPLEELKEQIELLVCFIPEGWEMPLGWNQVVSQAKEAIQKAMTIVEGKERE